jgi:hypothetical protein
MPVQISRVLEVLRAHAITPEEEDDAQNLPEVGVIEDGETIYTTSIEDVMDRDDNLLRFA